MLGSAPWLELGAVDRERDMVERAGAGHQHAGISGVAGGDQRRERHRTRPRGARPANPELADAAGGGLQPRYSQ